jgi:hypothetical protein
MKLIESKTLSTAQASIEFTSIPQTFTDLVALVSVRSADTSAFERLSVRFNSDSGTNYSGRFLYGDGGSATSSNRTGANLFSLEAGVQGTTSTANTFSNGVLYIPNYTSSVAKSLSSDSVVENNGGSAGLAITAGLWNNTAAITTVSFSYFIGAANLVAGCTISLYGVLKGSDGIVTTS